MFSKKPEYLLAFRITGTILAILVSILVVGAIGMKIADNERVMQFFATREAALQKRPNLIGTPFEMGNPGMMGINNWGPRRGEGRGIGFRNAIVMDEQGKIQIFGNLENAENEIRSMIDIPERTTSEIEIGWEEYVLYKFRIGGKTLVLYEPYELLNGPLETFFVTTILGILVFSVILFFVSLSIARRIIRPIEELAERERAYARHIAHELKTPLAVMRSDLELIRALPEESNERAGSSIEELDNMRQVIDDLLLLSASESEPKKTAINTQELIEKTIKTVEKSEGEKIRWKINNTLPSLEADPGLFETLLKNLILNAYRHGKYDSNATITLSESGLEIENMTDNDEKIDDSIFRPWVGTPGRGSGIGLSLVKRIADLHHWTIHMTKKDRKVTITVTF